MRHLLFALMAWGFALSIGTGGVLAGENSDVVEDILERGEVVCGVSLGLPGFSLETPRGRFKFKGFDYLVEARWRQEPPSETELIAFKTKVDKKITST